ncbi:redoxin domain-containing protein [Mycoplasma sp. NEAQ87857]|uniref:redoxin domain-containing protein n=1 Tax=Mycoplasma sp. NEAQ87857 TaxID=2683967 RepID=UPI0013182225|nr:redoxin domain-containing protein [Mycoplasma sp. NEAQ87857]QGZ97856.1 redoxin domain-containing protein [Mycoplasma sp. NEAQ87857]
MRKVNAADKELHFEGQEVELGTTLELSGTKAGEIEQTEILSNGKYTVIATFPSINTNVCDLQILRLSEISKEFPMFNYYSFSQDLPFALNEYVTNHPTGNITMYSDHKDRVMAKQLGLLLHEWKLLGRAMFVLDPENKVIYKQINSDIKQQVDFDKFVAKLKELSV